MVKTNPSFAFFMRGSGAAAQSREGEADHLKQESHPEPQEEAAFCEQVKQRQAGLS
jgi:hypothetical protein